MSKPLVSYHTNTFNHVHMLKNMFDSFFECNICDDFEWIVTDYGSTDGTQDYLADLESKNTWLKTYFGDQDRYFAHLEAMHPGLGPKTRRQIVCVIFGKAKNDARAMCSGDYYIDMPDDNQFIRKGDWVGDMMSVFEHRRALLGRNDVCSVLFRGMFTYRIHKPNNERHPVEMSGNGTEYYVAKHKHYDDYHMMPASVHEELGPFYQIDSLVDGPQFALDEWCKGNVIDPEHSHYEHHMRAALAAGYNKVFLKYPYAIDIPNDLHASVNSERDGLAFQVIELDDLKKRYDSQAHPVTTEQLIDVSRQTPRQPQDLWGW